MKQRPLPHGAKTLTALALKHPDKIEDWSKDSDGYWINLRPGWQWQECHAVHEWNMKDIGASFRQVERCDCKDCKRKFKND